MNPEMKSLGFGIICATIFLGGIIGGIMISNKHTNTVNHIFVDNPPPIPPIIVSETVIETVYLNKTTYIYDYPNLTQYLDTNITLINQTSNGVLYIEYDNLYRYTTYLVLWTYESYHPYVHIWQNLTGGFLFEAVGETCLLNFYPSKIFREPIQINVTVNYEGSYYLIWSQYQYFVQV